MILQKVLHSSLLLSEELRAISDFFFLYQKYAITCSLGSLWGFCTSSFCIQNFLFLYLFIQINNVLDLRSV